MWFILSTTAIELYRFLNYVFIIVIKIFASFFVAATTQNFDFIYFLFSKNELELVELLQSWPKYMRQTLVLA